MSSDPSLKTSKVYVANDGTRSTVLKECVNYEPETKEIEEYATFIGIDPAKEPELMWIAKEGLRAPMPSDWKAVKTDGGDMYYFNFRTGDSIWDHPLDDFYRDRVKAERLGRGSARNNNKAAESSSPVPLSDFVGIEDFPASSSSSTTPHRTLLRPVFLQHIHRFGATKFESPVTFKNVTSSWEDAMVNYSDISVCWNNLRLYTIHAGIRVALFNDTIDRLVRTATTLKGKKKNEGADELQYIDADQLITAALRMVNPDSSLDFVGRILRPRKYEKISKSRHVVFKTLKYISSFHEYLMCETRQSFSPLVIAAFFKAMAIVSKKGSHDDLISDNLRAVEENIFIEKEVDLVRKQRVFSALVSAAASSDLRSDHMTVPVGKHSKKEKVDEVLVSNLWSFTRSYADILSPENLVEFLTLAKERLQKSDLEENERISHLEVELARIKNRLGL